MDSLYRLEGWMSYISCIQFRQGATDFLHRCIWQKKYLVAKYNQ